MIDNNTFQYVIERMETEHESGSKRKDFIIIFLIAALIFSNFAWVCHSNDFQDTTTIEQEADTDGDSSNITQNVNGSILNGSR